MLHLEHTMGVIAEAWAEISQSHMQWCGEIFVIFEVRSSRNYKTNRTLFLRIP
jgi:hypothetical protein